jgi:hypothetical protein
MCCLAQAINNTKEGISLATLQHFYKQEKFKFK